MFQMNLHKTLLIPYPPSGPSAHFPIGLSCAFQYWPQNIRSSVLFIHERPTSFSKMNSNIKIEQAIVTVVGGRVGSKEAIRIVSTVNQLGRSLTKVLLFLFILTREVQCSLDGVFGLLWKSERALELFWN